MSITIQLNIRKLFTNKKPKGIRNHHYQFHNQPNPNTYGPSKNRKCSISIYTSRTNIQLSKWRPYCFIMFSELLASLIEAISDDFGDDEISQMAEGISQKSARETILENWLRQKQIASFFDKHEFIKKWVDKAHIQEVRELSMRAIDAQLKKFGVKPGERKRARFNLLATQNNVWWRKRNKTSPYAWRYLIDEHHSDRCIYRMRIHWKNKDGTSNIDICFLHKVRLKEKPFKRG